jgi:hypothetical protein
MKTIVRLASLFALFIALPLFAAGPEWKEVGSSGIIDEDSSALFAFTTFDLEFKTGQTGTITARYPVTYTGGDDPSWVNFIIGGWGPGVNVKLIRASECIPNGAVVVCETGASTSEGHFCTPCSDFNESLNFAQNAYYFEATLTRASTATAPRLHMIQLE